MKRICNLSLSLWIGIIAPLAIHAQSLVSGDISGKVMDPTSALVSGADVDLKSLDTGATQSTKTDAEGGYRFSLLKPGSYTVTVAHSGFEKSARQISVEVGRVAPLDFTLKIGQAVETVEVVASEPVLSASPSGTTTFTPLEVELLPSAGGDITNIAETAAGVVMNTTNVSGGSYGNFSLNGLPATSNLFTVNGENFMDPYFNINNSGATNLSLGGNEIAEATVIASPYGGQYGQLSGAQVISVTKSGSNAFHGNLQYFWNGRALNSNNWFNNQSNVSRPFSNANQWAASLGGRIIKNKTFFFVDSEGMRFVLPSVIPTTIPTAAFAAAVLNNVTAKQPGEVNAYKTMLNLWDTAPGASTATPLKNSSYCNSVVLPGYNAATTPCAAIFQATPSALANENVLAFRIDHRLTNKDNIYYRYKLDHGLQPTYLDPISANFDALSSQPEWDNQFHDTHVFSPRATNDFSAALSHYVAQFAQNPQKVASTFPYRIITSGAVPFTGFNPQTSFPQGRNVTQYQFIDDYTLVKGRNTFKFGENFRRYDVSDHTFFFNNPGVYFGYVSAGLQNFVNGLAYQYRGAKNFASDVPIAMWGMGMYAHDEIRVASNFTLTLGFRAEHNSNPVCQFNCLSNLKGQFSTLPTVTASTPGSVAYSSDFNFNQHQAYAGTDALNLMPSMAFSWAPGKSGKTVVSGGYGIFYDNAPAGLVDDLLANPPVSVALRVRPAAGILPFDPGPTGGAAVLAASQNAFNFTQSYNQISATLKGLGSVFTAPAATGIVGTVHSPRVQEWNLQVQREITASTAIIVNYVGNTTANLPYTNAFVNAYDLYGIYAKGIPESAPDVSFGQVTQIQSGAKANYHGLQITVRQRFAHNFSGHFNYTWSHALDEVSNGGIFSYGDSLLGQLNPGAFALSNYGNADYDIRHVVSADLVWTPKVHSGNKYVDAAFGAWQIGTKWTYHTGLPFSVTDSATALGNFSGALLAIPTGKPVVVSGGCGENAANVPCLNQDNQANPCLTCGPFLDSNDPNFNVYPGFSAQTRNQFRGPGFFDVDLSLFRQISLGEKTRLSLGMNAFNFLNHPNFANPDSGYTDSTYGMITGMSNAPTSAYGVGLGFDSSVRVIQMTGKITF